LDALRDQVPACLILDLHLPTSGGLELLRELRTRNIALPVVLISGHINRKTRERVLALGVEVILEKPLNSVRLLDEVRRVCGPHR
jgi:FixJ family two-component response regulator